MLGFLIGLALGTAPETVTIDVDGVQRTAIIVAPSSGGDKHPVIFGFHGHGGSARYAARRFDLQSAWPEAIAVYPDGLPTSTRLDPRGNQQGWEIRPNEDNRDIRFFDKLYKLVIDKYSGDPKRVFAMGHSNGGAFMYTLWGLRASKFAGLGSYEGFGGDMSGLKTPMPFFITIGDRDGIVPPNLQLRSLNAAKAIDGSQASGQPYGDKGTLYKGRQPVVFWSYPGTHIFPADAVPTMIRFFQDIASKG